MIPESLVIETAADRIATAAKMRRFGYDATPEQMAESVVAAVVREQDMFGPDEAFRWIEDHKKEMVKMLAAGIALADLKLGFPTTKETTNEGRTNVQKQGRARAARH